MFLFASSTRSLCFYFATGPANAIAGPDPTPTSAESEWRASTTAPGPGRGVMKSKWPKKEAGRQRQESLPRHNDVTLASIRKICGAALPWSPWKLTVY